MDQISLISSSYLNQAPASPAGPVMTANGVTGASSNPASSSGIQVLDQFRPGVEVQRGLSADAPPSQMSAFKSSWGAGLLPSSPNGVTGASAKSGSASAFASAGGNGACASASATGNGAASAVAANGVTGASSAKGKADGATGASNEKKSHHNGHHGKYQKADGATGASNAKKANGATGASNAKKANGATGASKSSKDEGMLKVLGGIMQLAAAVVSSVVGGDSSKGKADGVTGASK